MFGTVAVSVGLVIGDRRRAPGDLKCDHLLFLHHIFALPLLLCNLLPLYLCLTHMPTGLWPSARGHIQSMGEWHFTFDFSHSLILFLLDIFLFQEQN